MRKIEAPQVEKVDNFFDIYHSTFKRVPVVFGYRVHIFT